MHTIWKSTLSGEYDTRGIALILPGHTYQVPNSVWSANSQTVNNAVGTTNFYGQLVATSALHGLSVGQLTRFTGLLPAPLIEGTLYYVLPSGFYSTQLEISTTPNGAPIDVGYPINDAWLFDVVTQQPGQSVNDPKLHPLKPTIYSTTVSAAFSTNANLGWWGTFYAAFNWTQSLSLTVTESLATSDSAVKASTRNLTTTESISTSDSSVITQAFAKSATESLATADSAVFRSSANRSASESLVIADSPVFHEGLLCFASETLFTADSVARTATFFRTTVTGDEEGRVDGERLVMDQSPFQGVVKSRSTTDTLVIADAATFLKVFGRLPTESLVISDLGPLLPDLLDEGFEGTGAPSGWSSVGSVDYDYAVAPLVQLQSMRLAGDSITVPAFTLALSVLSPEACHWTYTINANAGNFPNWQCGSPNDNAPFWNRSFSPGWYAYWGSPPNGDTGDWFEDNSNDFQGGLWAIVSPCNPVDCSDPEQSIIACWLRYGTVNGSGPGWHGLLRAMYTYNGGATQADTGYVNHFIGSTLTGTFSMTLDGWTWGWTFTQL
jgi:hypothetical protein